MARTYVADLPGGTATTTIQIQDKTSIKQIVLSVVQAAAGTIEVSTSSGSQIGTAQPTKDVIVRAICSATAGNAQTVFDVAVPVVPFQSIYVHQTGAGNLGKVNLIC